MDVINLPAEFERSKSKIAKIDARKELASGFGATTGGQALVRLHHDRLTEAFRYALLDAHAGSKKSAPFVIAVRALAPELLALMSIQTLLHSIAQRETLKKTFDALGAAAAGECWAAQLKKDEKGTTEQIARRVKQRHKLVSSRMSAMKDKVGKAIAAGKLGLDFSFHEWEPEALVVAGAWLWNVVSTALPEVFHTETVQLGLHRASYIRLHEESWGIVEEALDRAMRSSPVFWPTPSPPKPWAYWNDGGSLDDRVKSSILRTRHKATQASVKSAIKSGQMQPALDALNTLQAVAYKINLNVLEVVEQCADLGHKVKGITPANLEFTKKPNAFAWAALSKEQQAHHSAKNAEVAKRNSSYLSDRLLYAEDMTTAYAMLEHPRFYTPMNCDWRGRVYGLSHFNFQREDRVRALFLFADGEPIGYEGIEWLKVHTANCGDFKNAAGQKISKRPMAERKQWCDDNLSLITNTASAPLVHCEWMGADKPFLFLAACFELSAALVQGSSYITRLPISFDGSCSGLQHLSAMTRAEEGAMVNLTPSQLPQDVYQVVAEDAKASIAVTPRWSIPLSASLEADARCAELFMAFDGNWRTMVKRNVMTYSYSSKKFGMASQQQVDLMMPLQDEVLEGKREAHPFEGLHRGPYDKQGNQQPSKAARFLAGHVYEAITRRIHKPAEAMEFLQAIAKVMAHEGKPVVWTTPVGIPWINRYHEPIVDRIELFLNDGGLKVRTTLCVATGDKKEIDKDKAANGVAPNFVHALDAAHLLLVALAAKLAGISSMATVHDSFGCLASQATRFNAIIREQFALMYSTHDVLSEILERSRAELSEAGQAKLPTLPTYGNLNLQDIIHAEFAFA